MKVRCSYCNWIGQEPNRAEFETQEEYEAAYAEYNDSHDNPERNTCPLSEES